MILVVERSRVVIELVVLVVVVDERPESQILNGQKLGSLIGDDSGPGNIFISLNKKNFL